MRIDKDELIGRGRFGRGEVGWSSRKVPAFVTVGPHDVVGRLENKERMVGIVSLNLD